MVDQHMFKLNSLHIDHTHDKFNTKVIEEMIRECLRLKDTLDLEKEKIKYGR